MLLARSGLYYFSYYRYDNHYHPSRLGRVGPSCASADNRMNSNAYLMASWVSM